MINWNTTSEHCVRFVSIEKIFQKTKNFKMDFAEIIILSVQLPLGAKMQ